MGEKFRVETLGDRSVVLMDSTAYADPSDTGHIVVAGSHGGIAGISFVNQTAATLGFAPGEPLQVAIRRVFGKTA